MIIAEKYSLKDGEKVLGTHHAVALEEVYHIIDAFDASLWRKPSRLQHALKSEYEAHNWRSHREWCTFAPDYYTADYKPTELPKGEYREIDHLKDRVGLEAHFGKETSVAFNVCAKMTIFRNLGVIDAGIEIVPVRVFANQMANGDTSFEELVWYLKTRGTADIDVPVLVLGIASPPQPE